MSDLLSNLTTAEVSITGATTLTSGAFGKMHVCTGTSADYTVGLPAVSGNAGRFIGIRMDSTLTKLVTLDANSSETIDGALTRVLWSQEDAILLCDGAMWAKVAGRTRPFLAQMSRSTGQSISANTVTKVQLATLAFDTSGLFASTSANSFTVRRAGKYFITASWYNDANSNLQSRIHLNGTEVKTQVSQPLPIISDVFNLAVGDVVEFYVFSPAGVTTRTETPLQPRMTLAENPEW